MEQGFSPLRDAPSDRRAHCIHVSRTREQCERSVSSTVIFNGKETRITDEQEGDDLKQIKEAFVKAATETGYVIDEIARIRNPYLEARYLEFKEMMGVVKGRGWANERIMFHGTAESNISS
jgi:hypothetical protein